MKNFHNNFLERINQFVKDKKKREINLSQDMMKKDNELNKINEDLKKKLKNILEENTFDKNLFKKNEILISPENLDPLINKMNQKEEFLENDNKRLTSDLFKLSEILESLTDENKNLRLKLNEKNEDLKKLSEEYSKIKRK